MSSIEKNMVVIFINTQHSTSIPLASMNVDTDGAHTLNFNGLAWEDIYSSMSKT